MRIKTLISAFTLAIDIFLILISVSAIDGVHACVTNVFSCYM